MLKAILRFLVPLRTIAAELRLLRRLAESVAKEQYGIVLADERLLSHTPKADRVEFSYGVGKQKPEDAMRQQEAEDAEIAQDEFEDYLK